MAKSKKKGPGDDAPAEPVAGTSRTDELLAKMFGRGVVVSGAEFLDKPEEVLSISPKIDEALGGGFLVGTLITLCGPSGCGKTTTALHAAAKWQQRGGTVYYIAAEMRILHRDLTQHRGLDVGAIKFIRSYEGQILDAQGYLLAAETILKNERRAMVIIDSFSILSEQNEMTSADYAGIPPGGSNRLVGSFCRRMAPIIPINDNLVIGIAQIYTNIGGKKKWADSMPVKVKFARQTGLYCSYVDKVSVGEGDSVRPIGQAIHWEVERSPFGPPGRKFTSSLRFGVGIDDAGEAVDLAEELKLVKKGGSWYELAFLGEEAPKFQGREKVIAFLDENPDHLNTLLAKLRYFLDVDREGDAVAA